MANYCIVCEFNPLHKGHGYLLRRARERGADTVTCIMSGNSTQRGELAVIDKYLRAEAAVKCGADLVLELPYPWCSASADYFAAAAVHIASRIGDTLFFGSECGDIEMLTGAAQVCQTQEFKDKYSEYTKNGMGAAVAYAQCLDEYGYSKMRSNDILAIAYIRAIYRTNAKLAPITIAREGAAYNQSEQIDSEFQSATAMRNAINTGDINALERFLPKAMYDIILQEIENGNITDMKQAESAILGFFRLLPTVHFADIADVGGGLENRLKDAAMNSTTLEEMLEALRTKRYTDAKLRRAMLFSLTSVRADDLHALPEYTQLLAANSRGRALLSDHRKHGDINIITKPADAPQDTVQYKLTQNIEALYGLARKNKLLSGDFLRKKAYIMK